MYGHDGYVLGNWNGTGGSADLPTGVTYALQGARATLASADD